MSLGDFLSSWQQISLKAFWVILKRSLLGKKTMWLPLGIFRHIWATFLLQHLVTLPAINLTYELVGRLEKIWIFQRRV